MTLTDMMGPAHVDICRQAGKVCIRYVDRPVANGAHYEFSLKSKRDRTCATSRRVELLCLRQTAEDGCSLLRCGKEHCYSSRCYSRLERALVSWYSRQTVTDVSSKADESARNSLQRRSTLVKSRLSVRVCLSANQGVTNHNCST